MNRMILVLIALAVTAVAAGGFPTRQPVTSSRSYPTVVAASSDIASPDRVDAYGNDIANAVAEYSLDPAGDLYEIHAPQIELPRLGSPKS